jgi:hypothetical protein
MTAVNVVCQPRHNCIHLVTDAATYTESGVLVGVGSKVYVEPNWPGLITGRGSAIAVPLLGVALSLSFSTFDAMIAKIEDVLPGMIEYYGIKGHAELIVAGFSQERGGPEAYVIETTDEAPIGINAETAAKAKAAGFHPDAFKLQRLPDIVVGPPPPQSIINAANFRRFKLEDDPSEVISGLSKVVEMQRHSRFDDGICWVGGYAQVTTIRSDGSAQQRIMQRWDEDTIGELMTPVPIDWNRFTPFSTGQHRSVVPFKARKARR